MCFDIFTHYATCKHTVRRYRQCLVKEHSTKPDVSCGPVHTVNLDGAPEGNLCRECRFVRNEQWRNEARDPRNLRLPESLSAKNIETVQRPDEKSRDHSYEYWRNDQSAYVEQMIEPEPADDVKHARELQPGHQEAPWAQPTHDALFSTTPDSEPLQDGSLLVNGELNIPLVERQTGCRKPTPVDSTYKVECHLSWPDDMAGKQVYYKNSDAYTVNRPATTSTPQMEDQLYNQNEHHWLTPESDCDVTGNVQWAIQDPSADDAQSQSEEHDERSMDMANAALYQMS